MCLEATPIDLALAKEAHERGRKGVSKAREARKEEGTLARIQVAGIPERGARRVLARSNTYRPPLGGR
jgi:hypothetical protein